MSSFKYIVCNASFRGNLNVRIEEKVNKFKTMLERTKK